MFKDILQNIDRDRIRRSLTETNSQLIPAILDRQHLSYEDYLLLLSPAAEPHLQAMAGRARSISRRQFGQTIQFYVPLYLSNHCCNRCLYCGFNSTSQVARVTLNEDQIKCELKVLQQKGFKSILLLTGEDNEQANIDYLCRAITLAREYFELVTLEVYPLSVENYQRLLSAGADGVTIYQETYDRDRYDSVHLSGPKKDYFWRLATPERALNAGMRKLGLGVLLGLTDWRQDMAILGLHLDFLMKKYWKAEYTISFPRIRNQGVGFDQYLEISDKNLVQMILAVRLFQPSVGLIASTRESAEFRDKLLDIGITQLSAESRTNPGGYSGQDSLEQFAISDQRELRQIIKVLEAKGFDPVMKDWHQEFSRTNSQ